MNSGLNADKGSGTDVLCVSAHCLALVGEAGELSEIFHFAKVKEQKQGGSKANWDSLTRSQFHINVKTTGASVQPTIHLHNGNSTRKTFGAKQPHSR